MRQLRRRRPRSSPRPSFSPTERALCGGARSLLGVQGARSLLGVQALDAGGGPRVSFRADSRSSGGPSLTARWASRSEGIRSSRRIRGVSCGARSYVSSVESAGWWAFLRDWFWRVVRAPWRRAEPLDWFEELFADLDRDHQVPLPSRPVLPPTAVETLGRQLNALTPWNVQVEVDSRPQGTAVRCRSNIGASCSAHGVGAIGADVSPLNDLVDVLHGVQSFMTERTKRAWPGTDRLTETPFDDVEAWLERLPLRDGRIEDGVARLWFGDREDPVVELDPIPLR